MIRVEEKLKLIQHVGSQYNHRVEELLLQRGITNKKGKPYSNTTVSMVVNGDRRNPAIEDAVRTIILQEEKAKGLVDENGQPC